MRDTDIRGAAGPFGRYAGQRTIIGFVDCGQAPVYVLFMNQRLDYQGWDDDAESAPVKPLSREQAQALRAAQPSITPWQVVALQALAGLIAALAGFTFTGRVEVGLSALYGVFAVVLPAAVLARGMGRLSGAGPALAVVGFMVWEGVKIALTVAILVAASRVVPHLNWPALLAGLAVCLSVNWLVLPWRGRVQKNESRR